MQMIMYKIPLVVTVTRIGFLAYGVGALIALRYNLFPATEYSYGLWLYLVILYFIGEKLYATFRSRGIDLSYAFPLLFATYLLNLVASLIEAQDHFPLLNRVEHFASFVLLTYVVWIFFLKYLTQDVWRDHPYYTSLLVFSIVAAFGVVNEIVELGLDFIFNTRLIGSGLDTSLDLLMNSLGSGGFLAIELMLGLPERSRAKKLASKPPAHVP